MDLRFLDKASDMTPILVRLYDTHKLYALAKDKQPEARSELTSAVTELFQLDLSSRESELVADVLIELIRQAEKDLKEALSERLSVLDNVPLRLALKISNDEIDVARPMLRNSTVLGDMDLIYIIKSKTPEYWPAIAGRKELNDKVIDVLADTNDETTAQTLVENTYITLTSHAVESLSEMAKTSEKLAKPFLRREEVTEEVAHAVFDYVGEELKFYIKENYRAESPEQQKTVSKVVDTVVQELKEEKKNDDYTPTDSMFESARHYRDKELLNLTFMLSTLRRGQIRAFIAQFSTYTDIETNIIKKLLKQKSGQGLAILCKGHNITKSDFVSIYLLTNRMRSGASIMVDVNEMNKALGYYERITHEVACEILKGSANEISLNEEE